MESFAKHSERSGGTAADTRWDLAPYAVLVADTHGVVQELNNVAATLFPAAAPGLRLADVVPAWLGTAHWRLTGGGDGRPPSRTATPVRGMVGERSFEARPVLDAAGRVVWWLDDDTEHRRVTTALRAEREHVGFLADASERLLASLNPDRCMDTVSWLAAGLAEAALVVAASGPAYRVSCCVRGGWPVRAGSVHDVRTLPGLAESLRGSSAEPVRWIEPSAVPGWAVPEQFGAPGPALLVPLPGHGDPAGALLLLRRVGSGPFRESDTVFVQLFATRAGAALSAARLYAQQASITAVLTRELLPPQLPRLEGAELAAGYWPSGDSQRIGGDFYDVHSGADGAHEPLIALGDVSGKGLEAAVLTGKIRNTLQALVPMADDHQRMLDLLNGALLNSQHARFVTLVLASVVHGAGALRLRLTSAGHPAPLIVRADGTVEEAATAGTLIGVLPSVEARTVPVSLAPGDVCLLYTDGIPEARGGPLGDDFFGEGRLWRVLTECAGMQAEAVVDHVQMSVSEWVGTGQHDDMALVAVRAPYGDRPRGPG